MIQNTAAIWRTSRCRETVKARHRHGSLGRVLPDWQRLYFAGTESLVSLPSLFPPSLPFEEVLVRALKECPSIAMNPKRMHGLPCISGTRIPVHLVLWAVEHRGSIDGAIESYPDLTVQQVKDALYFAETVMGSKSVLDETTTTP